MSSKEIVLTKEQQESVNFSSGDLIVRGTAGSGKSLVLMHRALKFSHEAAKEGTQASIRILTYTNALTKYIKDVITANNVDGTQVEFSTVDKYGYDVFYAISGSRPKFIPETKNRYNPTCRTDMIQKALELHQAHSKTSHRFYSLDTEFWGDEFKWIKEKNLMSSEQYIESDRSGRGGKVRMSNADKAVAFEIFSEYCRLLNSAGYMDWEDMYIYIINHADSIPAHMKCDYLLIDEAQDLSLVKFKFAKLVTRKSVTIAADMAQKIYKTSFTWKETGIDIRGRASKALSKPFRSTKQIVCLAESLREFNRLHQTDKGEFTNSEIPEREGPLPSVISCSSAVAEREIVVNLIRRHKNDVVGVLYRSWNEKETVEGWLNGAGISFETVQNSAKGLDSFSLSQAGVKLCTMHSAKGLEFDVIILPLFVDSVCPSQKELAKADKEQEEEILVTERNILYVALTRAKFRLYLTFSGTPSRFLNEFGSDLYEYQDNYGKSLEKPERSELPE